MVKAFDFYDSLVKEGLVHPDSITLKAPEARALFAQNQAGFICQGAWCIATWRKDNPDLDFGVMTMPVPDEGAKGKLPYIGSQPWMGISGNSIAANVNASEVYANVSDVTPSLGEIVQGVLAQNVDYKAELKALSEKTQAVWEKAIQSTPNVSLEDFEFKNWDPMKNYEAEMYKNR